jgi:hypothetical protein
VGAENLREGLLFGLAQFRELLGHMGNRAVVLADLDALDGAAHSRRGGRIPGSGQRVGHLVGCVRDGTVVDGFAEIRNYVVGTRRPDLLKTLARTLTGYALSRAVLPSDRALVDAVGKTLIEGGRWSDALRVIVRSEQFQSIRPAASTALNTR